jgi:hypothetical protein
VVVAKDNTEQGSVPPQQVSWRSPGNFFVGVDLGQSTDPTAVCILEGYAEVGDPADGPRYFYDVRFLMRFPLGMSYPRMVTDIGTMLTRPPLNGSKCELLIDETGVGRAVGDIFDGAGLKPLRIAITAGNEATQSGMRRYSVPKQELVSTLDAMLNTGELRFAKELREAPTLQDELKDFRRHVSEAGRYSFSARDGKHDDLVLAVAIALWRAVKRKKYFGEDRSPPNVIRGYAHTKPHRSGRGGSHG